jgi:hypothetical protein
MPAAASLIRSLMGAGRRADAAPGPLRPTDRRTAPRALAWGVAVFAVAQLGLGLAAELYPRLRDPLYGDKLVKLQRRLPAEPTPTVVMLGSSRTGLGFHGKHAERVLAAELGRPAVAFNYGVPASGPVTHLVYLNRLLRDGVAPDLVLVEVMPSMLTGGPGAPLEKNWFFADRLTFREQDTVIRHGFPAEAVRGRWRESVLVPAYALRFQLMSRISPSWLPWQLRFDWSRGSDECGWGTTAAQSVDPARRTRGVDQARAEYAAILAGLQPGGPAVAALEELLAVCRGRGIAVRLVLMPEGTLFRGFYGPGVSDRLMVFLAALTDRAGVPRVVDCRGWLPDGAFYDSHHMFADGAQAFTDRLTREVIAPALREKMERADEASGGR